MLTDWKKDAVVMSIPLNDTHNDQAQFGLCPSARAYIERGDPVEVVVVGVHECRGGGQRVNSVIG